MTLPPRVRFHKWGLALLLSTAGSVNGAFAAAPGEDSELPTGTRILPGERPASSPERRACSARQPVCVQGVGAVSDAALLRTLDALELAYERLVDVLALPAPLRDEGLGGGAELDAYVSPALPGSEPIEVHYDPPREAPFDSASAFCLVTEAEGALLDRAATLCVGEAIALALDPAETPHLRRAFATELWWITGTPTALDLEAVADFQRTPERAVVRRERDLSSEGAALLFEYLEQSRAEGAPGTLSSALFSASAQAPSSGELLFRNEPDLMDVLRHTLDDRSARLVGLFRDFSVTRTFLGASDDGLHLPTLGWSGRFGVPPFDWSFPLSSLPRRVLLSKPVEPSGAALLELVLDQPAQAITLGFQAEWEAPVAFAWTFVKVDAEGRELGRIDVPFQQRATEVEARITELGGARSVRIIGTYLDEVTLAHPFDPDVEPFESHGATVYLVRL